MGCLNVEGLLLQAQTSGLSSTKGKNIVYKKMEAKGNNEEYIIKLHFCNLDTQKEAKVFSTRRSSQLHF